MKNVNHNTKTWFEDSTGKDFVSYFESDFKENKLNVLKFPASYVKKWTDNQGKFNKAGAAEAIANTYLSGIVRMYQGLLGITPFSLLEEDTRGKLLDAVCEAVQHAIVNRNVFQRITASTITSNTFSINQDTTDWILTSDMFGMFAWTLIMNSGLEGYEWKEEDALFVETGNGNIKVIGSVDLDQVPDLTGAY